MTRHIRLGAPSLILIIILWSLCLLSPTAATQGPPDRLLVPGIGFTLTPDYGTAAISFHNTSFVEVAKIEGSAAYKFFMRDMQSRIQTGDTLRCSFLGVCPQDSNIAAAAGMLHALKSSVESYLGTTFCYADVAIPDPRATYQKVIIEKAFKSIGLRRVAGTGSAAMLAIVANRAGRPREVPDPSTATEHIILTIDYSRSGLSVVLFSEDEDGIVEPLRQEYHRHLGVGSRLDDGKRWEEAKAKLEKITRAPFGRSYLGIELPDQIENLVLYGERVDDIGLRDLLTDILGSELVDNAQVFDPVFASS